MTNRDAANPTLRDPELVALARLFADDEATPAQRADFESRRERLAPADRRALDDLIASERALRAATARALLASTPETPADLRARVLRAAHADSRDEHAGPPVLFRLVRANWAFAAAAAILLALVAGMLVLSTTASRGPMWTEQDGASASLVNFLASEHSRCSEVGSSHANRKLTTRDPQDAVALVARFVPIDPARLLDAAGEGYIFLGAGPCAVPGGGSSIHLVFVSDDESCAPVSIFLQDASSRSPDHLPGSPVSLGHCPDGSALRMARVHDASGHDALLYIAAPTDALADDIIARLARR